MTLLRYFGSLVLLLILYAACVFVVVPAQQPPKPAIKPVALTSVQIHYFEQVNQDIENLPEVKVLRAKQQAFITGIATSHGITGNWRLTPDGNGGLFLDAETKP